MDSAIMMGTAVFPGTRLVVAHVARMSKKGATVTEIIEDYPYLSEQDIRFAVMYVDLDL